ncbi:UNVERIFIED_CONTAM: hypothetical protein DES50_108196 [Williamsia faeni]
MRPWKDDVVDALRALGGEGNLSAIYEQVALLRSPRPKSWKATVRNTIECHSSDSDNFRGEDLFYSVNGLGLGNWGLR